MKPVNQIGVFLAMLCLLIFHGAAKTRAAGGDTLPLRSLEPPVLLPDGKEFRTWEPGRPPAFTKTYYVNASDPSASDDNPGTKERPFETINRAAQVLQGGERVVVAAGIYRERVRPARGGMGPDRLISYEAAPGASVIISGSRVLDTKWAPSVRDGKSGPEGLWMTKMPSSLFGDENPFAQINLADGQIDKCMDWAIPIKGKPPITLRRGLVFLNGRRLRQAAAYDQLAGASGSYWIEPDGLTVHISPADNTDPNQAKVEVTVRGFVFAPEAFGLGYIRVKGFIIEHSGNCFPRPQQGALSTQRGHHWVIEDNIVRECNSIGIDIGDQFDTSGPRLAEGGQHIVRRNMVTDCGIGGIEGKSIEHTLIEDNIIRRCGWHKIWGIFEVAGIKVHLTRSTVIRRNLVADTTDAPGIWMDYGNINSRCTGNVILNVQNNSGGIFMEASQQPNLVDTNFVWGTRGNGIYQHDCDALTIAHNLIVGSTDAAVRMQIVKGRRVGGRLSTAKRNRILNNIFVDNSKALAISDPDNVCDYNVFGSSAKPLDLAAWQDAHRTWDTHSVTAGIRADFNPQTMELKWSLEGDLPKCPRIASIEYDFGGRPLPSDMVLPGPFEAMLRQPAYMKFDTWPQTKGNH